MAKFDPLKYGATPVQPEGKFDPYAYGATPVDPVVLQKEERVRQGLPVSVRSDRAEPTIGGEIVRGIIKPVIRPALNIENLPGRLKSAVTGQKYTPQEIKNNYLGRVTEIGGTINEKSDKLAKEVREGKKSLPKALAQVEGTAALDTLDAASFLPSLGVSGKAASLTQKLLKGPVAKYVAPVVESATRGGLTAGAYNASQQLSDTGNINLGDVAKSAALGTALDIGISQGPSAIGKGVDSIKKSLQPKANQLEKNIADNVNKALAPRGAKNFGQLQRNTQQKVEGIKILQRESPNIEVLDEDGLSKPFVPEKSNFYEVLQAQSKAKKQVVDKMTAQLKEAGEKGIKTNYAPTYDYLKNKALKGIDQDSRNTAQKFISELDDFRKIHGDDPSMLHEFIELQNKKLSAKYKQGNVDEITGEALDRLRKALDNIVDRTSYGKEYGALKSLEGDLVREAQRLARQKGSGLEQFADNFGNVDFILGLVTQNPAILVKALATKVFFNKVRASKQPQAILQKAFKDARLLQVISEKEVKQNPSNYRNNSQLNDHINGISRNNDFSVGDSTKTPTDNMITNIITNDNKISTPSEFRGIPRRIEHNYASRDLPVQQFINDYNRYGGRTALGGFARIPGSNTPKKLPKKK